MLSRDSIKQHMVDGDIKIYPFENKNLTGIGYNLSTTNFAFSINQGVLLTVRSKTTPDGIKHYVIIPPNDTVLFFSKEYIGVSNLIGGTFHSKVARVCQGLGHISTTLDPTWHGQLIISVNNPTSAGIKFEMDEKSGNIFTLLMYRFDTAVQGFNIHDNYSGRCDLLLERFAEPSKGRWKQKHLQLKEYIVNEFADSLNGYDDFLDQDINDEYAKKIVLLKKVKEHLKKDHKIIEEGRYEIGKGGVYYPLSEEERLLFQSCTLYKVKNEVPYLDKVPEKVSMEELEKESFYKEELSKIPRILREYIKIIDYELEMLNHIRRIRWQNEKALEFAGEESELVRLRRRSKHIKTWMKNIAFIAILAVLVFLFLEFNISDGLSKLFLAVISCYLAAIFPSISNDLKSWWSGRGGNN